MYKAIVEGRELIFTNRERAKLLKRFDHRNSKPINCSFPFQKGYIISQPCCFCIRYITCKECPIYFGEFMCHQVILGILSGYPQRHFLINTDYLFWSCDNDKIVRMELDKIKEFLLNMAFFIGRRKSNAKRKL